MSGTSIIAQISMSLSYQLSLRPLFCLFLNGRFTQVFTQVFIVLHYKTRIKHKTPTINGSSNKQ